MLLYSAKFPVVETLGQDDFIQLVIKWNQESPHNKMNGIQWDGSRNVRYEDGAMTLAIEELRAYNIVATRFRKEDERGVVWTTDFVLNFKEHILAIRLDRETTEDTISFIPTFSPPHLVKMIVKEKLAGMDNNLLISEHPITILKDNYEIIADIILEKKKYALPIVYITKTWLGNYPLDVVRLARKLQGVAHVLREADPEVSKILKETCSGENVHHGGIAIYYPSQSARTKKINTTRYAGIEDHLIKRIVEYIYRYTNQQRRESMYTWEGIQNELLRLKNESLIEKRQEAEAANLQNKDLLDMYDEEIERYKKDINDLNNRIAALNQENQGLRSKLEGTDAIPLLFFGEEEDLYEGEIREIVLDILAESLKNKKKNTRREHIILDLLDENEYSRAAEIRRNEIKKILKGYSTMSASMRAELQDFGFIISSDGKHHKLTYYGDSRYVATMAKSSSDIRAGNNLASEIDKIML